MFKNKYECDLSVFIKFSEHFADLRILTGKNYPKIKLSRSPEIRLWTFWSLVHQINSFSEVKSLLAKLHSL